MDLRQTLKVSERLELRVENINYRSTVQDIPYADTLLALHPLDKCNLPIHMERDDPLDVIYFRTNGQFVFPARLESRDKVGETLMVRIRSAGEPTRYQRRAGFRLEHRMPLVMHPINPSMQMREEYATHMVDISEGGLQVLFPGMVEPGTYFRVQFSLDMGNIVPVDMRAAVSRMMPPAEQGQPWKLGLSFLDCPEDVRKLIARYIMQVQRRLRLISVDGPS